MKKYRLTFIASVCILALSACSSSSGGGGGSNPRFLDSKPADSNDTNTSGNAGGTIISAPTTNSSTTDNSTTNGSTTGNSATDNSAASNSTTDNSTTGNSTTSGSTTGNSTTGNSATSGSTADNSATSNSTTNGSTTNGSTTGNSTTSTSTENSTAAKLGTNLFQKESESRLAGAIVSVDKNNNVTNTNLVSGAKASLDELVVNGATIYLKTQAADDEQSGFNQIVNNDVKSGTLGNISGAVNKTALYDTDTRYYQFIRFGVINTTTASHLFVQGLQTPVSGISYGTENGYQDLYKMPTSGKVRYKKGEALYGNNGTYESFNADVTADFDNKVVSVSLKDNAQAEKIAFTSNISGNTFSGTSNGIESKGAFYGSQANQIGGVFYDTNTDKNGVFGATDKRTVSE